MTRELFSIATYCSLHNIEHTFIETLTSEGLITVTSNEEGEFIEEDQLHELEIYTRWHHELGINPEGMDAIRHLVNKLRHVQSELNFLKNRLRLYEDNEQFIGKTSSS